MPKKAMDYSKCVIYKIVCNDLSVTDCYVGHTTNFTQRKKQHKCDCNVENNKHYNFKLYQTIRANGGWENWSMIEIEKYNCKDIYESIARERYWYEQLKANLNICVPNRSPKEWLKDNPASRKKTCKEYYEKNKEKIKEKESEKYVCDCGGFCRIYTKNRHFKSKKHQDFISSNNKDASSVTETEEIESI